MDLGLAGHSMVVTGGSSGIGLATARTLLAEGAWVTICGRDPDRLAAARDDLGPHRVAAVVADVLVPAEAAAVVDAAVAHAGRLDGVAAIAGRGRHGSLLDLDPADVGAEIAGKVNAVLNVVRPALGALATSHGRIVALVAPTARTADPAMGAVSAGRAALDTVIDALAREVAPRRVRVNGVGVGLIDTPRQRSRHAAADTALGYDAWLQAQATSRSIPLGRAGTPDEVAAAVVFLLSPVSSYSTGTVIDVTGGLRSR
ncbi:MAG: SDR family oxidoreductase [Acidimicrobiales bacterium]